MNASEKTTTHKHKKVGQIQKYFLKNTFKVEALGDRQSPQQ